MIYLNIDMTTTIIVIIKVKSNSSLTKWNVSGYLCNHGSLNRERDAASPRGRYGERLQRDSCLKHKI